MEAELTLTHLGRERVVVVVGRDLEGTRHHAIAAPDALPGVVSHRPHVAFAQGPDDTGGDAGGTVAVEAVGLHVNLLGPVPGVCPGVHDGVGIGRRPAPLAENRLVIIRFHRSRLEAIGLLAGVLAQAAADAHRQVHQNPHRIGRRLAVPVT